MKEEYSFTENQSKLLSMGVWAKNLARIALIAYFLLALSTISQNLILTRTQYGQSLENSDLLYLLRTDQAFLIKVISDVARSILRGVIFYTVLESISLSTHMIVETDINYREQKEHGEEL
jgi:hypothetical protein